MGVTKDEDGRLKGEEKEAQSVKIREEGQRLVGVGWMPR